MAIKKPKALVIVGPNASGKSNTAIRLAKKFNGEVVSADSRQVYKGMDIGSGKVEGELLPKSDPPVFVSEGVNHYCIDIVEPTKDYNVALYKKDAQKALRHILSKGKLPIICGGTGFWISAVIDDIDFPKVPPNRELRKKIGTKSEEELLEMLKGLDPDRAKTVDKENPVRLIRAIEIAKSLGSVPKPNKKSKYNLLMIGIKWPKEKLHKRIKVRLDQRLEDGMIDEVKRLNKEGVSWKRLERFGLEYKRVSELLQHKLTIEEMKKSIYLDDVQYAKRQMTWFKKDKRIKWVKSCVEIEKEVEKW